MNTKSLEYFKNILVEKRKEILAKKRMLKLAVTEQDTNSGDLKYPTHLADLGSDTMGKELNSYFNARTGKYLKHLDEALKRIEKCSYGFCLSCGEEIQRVRLEVVPHTRYCVNCKDKKTIENYANMV